MTDQTVTTTTDTGELTGYSVTSAELRRVADALETLPPVDRPLYAQLTMLPDGDTAEAVDAVAMAVIGKPGETERGTDAWRRIVHGSVHGSDWATRFHVTVHATVPGPPDKRDAELVRLRAELAELRSKPAAFDRATIDADGSEQVPRYVGGYAHGERSGELVEVHAADGGCE